MSAAACGRVTNRLQEVHSRSASRLIPIILRKDVEQFSHNYQAECHAFSFIGTTKLRPPDSICSRSKAKQPPGQCRDNAVTRRNIGGSLARPTSDKPVCQHYFAALLVFEFWIQRDRDAKLIGNTSK
eukprot:scaffold6088_cov140-Skeletonema_dohrnii-CCMP3373.AAC.5